MDEIHIFEQRLKEGLNERPDPLIKYVCTEYVLGEEVIRGALLWNSLYIKLSQVQTLTSFNLNSATVLSVMGCLILNIEYIVFMEAGISLFRRSIMGG